MRCFRIVVAPEREDAATTLLWELGTAGVEVRDSAGTTALVAYFQDRPGLEASLAAALGPTTTMEEVAVPQVDWVGRFREGFRPLRAGGFCIAPVWDVPARPEGRLLVVDPGRAFGTGTHETTRLCLAALEAAAAKAPLGRVLDVGTGSGILAIAAALLGSAAVTAIDDDPEALSAARRHGELNHVSLRLVQGDGGRPFRPGAFDLVLANLTAPLLLAKRDEIGSARAASGTIVLAGLLADDLPAIRAAYAPLGPLAIRSEGEWACVVLEGRS